VCQPRPRQANRNTLFEPQPVPPIPGPPAL